MSLEQQKIQVADIACLAEELTTFQSRLHPRFKRREQRDRADFYLNGLLRTGLPNKSVETMMLHMDGDNRNAMRGVQHFLSEGAWDDAAVLEEGWRLVEEEIGANDGVLIVDGSDFPKQGTESVGVKRQYCGQLGKTANCQAGVYLGYASEKGRTLLDRRLYMPQEWLEEKEWAERRRRCGVPEKLAFQTKPQLAAQMVASQVTAGILRFHWLTCDEAFGGNSDFLDAIADHVNYFAEVPHTTRAWLQRPETEIPEWAGRGRKPTRERLVEGQPTAQPVSMIASAMQPNQWVRMPVKEGSKGTIVADFATQRVVNSRCGLPGTEIWLVIRRNIDTDEHKFYLSNASVETPSACFARIAGMRWPIETCFEEGKQQLGMGDYQVRSWTGWHHHMTFVILAHIFLMRVQRRMVDKAPQLTLPQAVLLMKASLPQPEFSAEQTIEIVNYYQERHEAARKSHRKRRDSRMQSEVSL